MNQDQNIKTVVDVTLGGMGVASIAWLPMLHDVSEVAASIAAIGGAFLVFIRLYFAMVAWRAYRISGKIPRITDD